MRGDAPPGHDSRSGGLLRKISALHGVQPFGGYRSSRYEVKSRARCVSPPGIRAAAPLQARSLKRGAVQLRKYDLTCLLVRKASSAATMGIPTLKRGSAPVRTLA